MKEYHKIQVEFAKLAMQAWLEAGARDIELGNLNDEADRTIFYSMCKDIAVQSFELSQAMMVEFFQRMAKGTLDQELEGTIRNMGRSKDPHYERAKELFKELTEKDYKGEDLGGGPGPAVPRVKLRTPAPPSPTPTPPAGDNGDTSSPSPSENSGEN